MPKGDGLFSVEVYRGKKEAEETEKRFVRQKTERDRGEYFHVFGLVLIFTPVAFIKKN